MIETRTIGFALLVTLGAALPGGAQSLAEVAQAEAARRAALARPAKVYTNKDLSPDTASPPEAPAISAVVPDVPADVPPAPRAAAATRAPANPAPTPRTTTSATASTPRPRPATTPAPVRAATAAPAAVAKDDAYWKSRMRTLEAKLGSDITAGEAAKQKHVSLLAVDLQGLSSAELKTLAASIQKATAEINRWTAAVRTDAEAIKALEGEAARANVPADRLRPPRAARALD